MSRKGVSQKYTDNGAVWTGDEWNVVSGMLKRPRGRPSSVRSLFLVIAEKLPFDSIEQVKKEVEKWNVGSDGVYMAHDSMGVARYGGRGQIFGRLRNHKKKYPKELLYFSFYIIADKNHERELETAILRASGPQMMLNQRKVRAGIEAGNVTDYEAGTRYFQRQRRRGARPRPKRGRPRKTQV